MGLISFFNQDKTKTTTFDAGHNFLNLPVRERNNEGIP